MDIKKSRIRTLSRQCTMSEVPKKIQFLTIKNEYKKPYFEIKVKATLDANDVIGIIINA